MGIRSASYALGMPRHAQGLATLEMHGAYRRKRCFWCGEPSGQEDYCSNCRKSKKAQKRRSKRKAALILINTQGSRDAVTGKRNALRRAEATEATKKTALKNAKEVKTPKKPKVPLTVGRWQINLPGRKGERGETAATPRGEALTEAQAKEYFRRILGRQSLPKGSVSVLLQ